MKYGRKSPVSVKLAQAGQTDTGTYATFGMKSTCRLNIGYVHASYSLGIFTNCSSTPEGSEDEPTDVVHARQFHCTEACPVFSWPSCGSQWVHLSACGCNDQREGCGRPEHTNPVKLMAKFPRIAKPAQSLTYCLTF